MRWLVAIQLGVRAGGSQGPVVKSSVSAWYLSLAPFVGGGEVGVDDGEFGEAQQGAPAAAAVALLDFHGPDVAFGLVVRPADRQVGGEPQDHVLVAPEPADQGAGPAGEFAAQAEVVAVAFGKGAEVVVDQGGQDLGVQPVQSLGAGRSGGLVRGGQGVG